MDKLNSLILRTSDFWQYLSQNQKDLIREGQYLMNDIIKDQAYQFKDYSFLVFPFAKAYEGFLKQLFKDTKLISHLDYISDHLRLGKLMSPNLIGRLGDRSLYKKIEERAGIDLAEKIWNIWKVGRNQIFHYFPHNIKAISFNEADKIITEILKTMEEAYERINIPRSR
ncbi:MAG: hypothetical protein US40_C0011G0040 [Candidatus Roizmanbacteria bacterium GW2011_GWC2_37_13]|uniref:Bacterial toxin RNase RnlA/LsoA DBD domain-containing protein n=1 Tax=Candidatus Roizmanbacteria bacterium GW2011_GWC2_37_13 TaxID=1618486 RepID=A0A0G0GGH8_9BACT|nr:MAG: hypothetical protein US38_C0007G0040 [Candidatus Roizmanbacteria bacterium GW2011_GWC1_37_12]KKQ25155.1 MAG: hypothetical protein US40_C0011G0040 [Candidatus Roizmanbacteria bacterium GW2011_GWC2_37_13]